MRFSMTLRATRGDRWARARTHASGSPRGVVPARGGGGLVYRGESYRFWVLYPVLIGDNLNAGLFSEQCGWYKQDKSPLV